MDQYQLGVVVGVVATTISFGLVMMFYRTIVTRVNAQEKERLDKFRAGPLPNWFEHLRAGPEAAVCTARAMPLGIAGLDVGPENLMTAGTARQIAGWANIQKNMIPTPLVIETLKRIKQAAQTGAASLQLPDPDDDPAVGADPVVAKWLDEEAEETVAAVRKLKALKYGINWVRTDGGWTHRVVITW